MVDYVKPALTISWSNVPFPRGGFQQILVCGIFLIHVLLKPSRVLYHLYLEPTIHTPVMSSTCIRTENSRSASSKVCPYPFVKVRKLRSVIVGWPLNGCEMSEKRTLDFRFWFWVVMELVVARTSEPQLLVRNLIGYQIPV